MKHIQVFFNELMSIYREGIRIRKDQRYKDETRAIKVDGLEARIRDLCLERACRDAEPKESPLEADYRRLCCEVLGLCVDEELFVRLRRDDKSLGWAPPMAANGEPVRCSAPDPLL